jgi:UPF0716 family protein affecting phage T7 exclusion
MEDLSSKQLNQSMQKLFGESESFINVQTEQRNGIFASAMNWSELVDVSDFSFGSNENITVGYYIQWEDGMEVSVHEQNSDTEIKLEESERYGGYQKVLEDKISSESLITQVSTTYVVDTIEVDTEFQSKDNLTRRIALVFQLQPDSEDQETIRKRIAQKAGRDAEVTNGEEREDGRSSIVIEQTGSIVEINQEFQAIFGVQGQLSHETSGNLMELHHTGSFSDLMDFTQFLENDPVMTTLIYRLKLPGGEKIQADSVSSTVKLRQGTEEIDGRQYTGTLTGAYLSLTFSSRKWNTDGMMLFVLLIGFVLLAVAILLLADFIRKVFEKLRNGVRVFNGSFGQKDQILEDFPEDEDEEMDEDEDELEDEPEDEDEEKKETEEKTEEEEDALEDKREVEEKETDEGEGESGDEPETKNEQTIAEEEKAPKNEMEEEEVENLVERITEFPLEI